MFGAEDWCREEGRINAYRSVMKLINHEYNEMVVAHGSPTDEVCEFVCNIIRKLEDRIASDKRKN